MTQEERCIYLIEELLKERKESVQIPSDQKGQRDLLRALMNVREPLPISQDFLQVQDSYLQERNKERGIVDLEGMECVKELVGSSPTMTQSGGQTIPAGGARLYLWQGDITRLKVDAIVNAANAQLLGCFSPLHACIDNCIHTFAGIQLRLACYELMQKQGKLEGTGLCKITPAFNLPSRFVLHTVGPIIRTVVGARDKILLENCYKNCLNTAAENGLESVAFCCISTGVFRFTADLAAQLAVKTVENWLMTNPEKSVKKVVFNVFGNKDLEIYKGIFGIK